MFKSCAHIKEHKESMGLTSYRVLHKYYVVSESPQVKDSKCSICQAPNFRQHACLDCVFFGCFHKHHIHEHAEEKKHYVAMDVASGYIYCFKCEDYVYDEEFDSVSRKQKEEALLKGTELYFEWEPSKEEIELLTKNKYSVLKSGALKGLRGLYNMGNTCYMNAVMQVLVHTPLLRNYFFAKKHTCFDDKDQCWGCIMSNIFQEFYSGCSTPLSLPMLLNVLWRDFTTFVGKEMQDSDEFYSSILAALHLCESKENSGLGHCKCFIHQIFSGFSKSKITCGECSYSTENETSFWAFNLNFGVEQIECEKTTKKSRSSSQLNQNLSSVHDPKDLDQSPALCLETLIESNMGTQSLESKCVNCDCENRTLKDTFKKLPIILCFHLNRKIMINGEYRKISTFVFFPECIDMAPYLSPEIATTDNTDNTEYNLFAVVVHEGILDGHNFSYIRVNNAWFKCNDHKVEEVDLDEVLSCKGYLLYYHKCVIQYEPDS